MPEPTALNIVLGIWLSVGLLLALWMTWIGSVEQEDPWWVVLFVAVVSGFGWPVAASWHLIRRAKSPDWLMVVGPLTLIGLAFLFAWTVGK